VAVLALASEDGTQPLFHFRKYTGLAAGYLIIYNERRNKIYARREISSKAEQYAEEEMEISTIKSHVV
jgi:hypothetical protein